MKLYMKVLIGIVAFFLFLIAVGTIISLATNQKVISPIAPLPIASPTATPVATPIPSFNVTLTPTTQTVILSLHQSASFKVSITQNGNNKLQFPCSITLILSNYPSYLQPPT